MLCNSVPGDHLFKNLQTFQKSVSFRFIPNFWSAEIRISDEAWREDRCGMLSIPPSIQVSLVSETCRALRTVLRLNWQAPAQGSTELAPQAMHRATDTDGGCAGPKRKL